MATHLVDTSALIRARSDGSWEEVSSPLMSGRWAICDVVRIEILRGTATRVYRHLAEGLAAVPSVSLGQDDFTRALEIQMLLSDSSKHQGVKPPNLLIAAAAEREGLIVIHHDHDFDLIASVCNVRTEWYRPTVS